MYKIVIATFFSFISVGSFAQNDDKSDSNLRSEVTFKVSEKKKRYTYFPANAPVTMADGTTKSIAEVKIGEHVRTCKDGKSTVTQVKQIDVYNQPASTLTALYLRPADAKNDRESQHAPALLLEATPHHLVQTKRGKKRMDKLSKRDILYHYEPATGLVSTWKVGAVQANARKVSKAYNLATVDGTYLVDNVMVANN
ncbi:hypothetical protein [Dyadobacter luticola]|uniref:Hint domain-containing protein n=1 Tax=Dyadobacter luticola TaxID=1979387 RepID=A0A5R9KSX2_9BACT|nr:hypothetical protein [Dyadobacter luticola]TLU99300.1 hypothetical protein FEN17_22300 [Dyadobacter luticola]